MQIGLILFAFKLPRTLSNASALCILRFRHSGCWRCELLLAPCILQELLAFCFLVVLFPTHTCAEFVTKDSNIHLELSRAHQATPLSLVFCHANSGHLGLPKPHSLPPQLNSSTVKHCRALWQSFLYCRLATGSQEPQSCTNCCPMSEAVIFRYFDFLVAYGRTLFLVSTSSWEDEEVFYLSIYLHW